MGAHSKHSHMSHEEQMARSNATFASSSRFSSTDDASQYSRTNGLAHYTAKRRQNRRKHRVLRTIGIAALALLVSGTVAVAAFIANINGKITRGVDSDLLNVLSDTNNSEPFYMLLLGIDKDEERAQSADYGESYSNYRTDTIILARVDPTQKKVTLVSIPRDTMVDMGANGKQKINSAYSYGGAAYATQVVEQFAGIKISHYAEIDMDGFAKVVDSIGGVDVDLPVAVQDPNYTGLDLPAGKQHLDGTTAGLLGRCRHGYDQYGGGDFYREANQRMLIGSVVDKVMGSDPLTIANSISTMAGYVKTDMDVGAIVSLATQFTGIDVSNDIYSGQCPTISKYVNNTWYEICDTEKWKAIMKRVDSGQPPYDSSSDDFTAGVAGSVGQSTVGSSDGSGSGDSSSVTPVHNGNVSVLNASGVSGVASNVANKLNGAGFTAAADNADSNTKTTKIYYNGDNLARAMGVAEKLGLDVEPVKNDGSVSTIVDVVVVIGSDYS
ncbi:LCP family protein [Parafannyhessea umbonata]|uniref:Transcriptional attenuator, LytR family n=1 Tax=Parafannyhessea umbonata TaxID=604330 RepID=A0A1H9R363_9ACTN|nr:LCP family protein [Parafannyhessea umbonata]SER67166.1 transcriptional attenuator, LytR family [Parafannyhessea umbonata]